MLPLDVDLLHRGLQSLLLLRDLLDAGADLLVRLPEGFLRCAELSLPFLELLLEDPHRGFALLDVPLARLVLGLTSRDPLLRRLDQPTFSLDIPQGRPERPLSFLDLLFPFLEREFLPLVLLLDTLLVPKERPLPIADDLLEGLKLRFPGGVRPLPFPELFVAALEGFRALLEIAPGGGEVLVVPLGGGGEPLHLRLAGGQIPGAADILLQPGDLCFEFPVPLCALGQSRVRLRETCREFVLLVVECGLGEPERLPHRVQVLSSLREFSVLRLGNLLPLCEDRLGLRRALRGLRLEDLGAPFQICLRALEGPLPLPDSLVHRAEFRLAR